MSDGKHWLRRQNLDGQVPIERVMAALRSAQQGEVCVRGVDGFTSYNHPSLDYILDLSKSSDGTGEDASVRQALAVIETWPADLLVELVVQ